MAEKRSLRCDLLVIGGSAGSLEVIMQTLARLKKDLKFPIVLVVHRKGGVKSILAKLFDSKSTLPVKEAEEKELMQEGHVYLAPQDYHLLIEEDKSFSLEASEKVNFCRPSIDVTFQSAAEVFKQHLVGVLLSGSNADGVEGIASIFAFNGRVMVQDPDSASMPYMPLAALHQYKNLETIPAEGIAQFINHLN